MRPIKTVTERHLDAYQLWRKHQNLQKVADELGVHYDTVANWSSFFEWRKKLAEDIANGDGNTMAIVAGFRKNAITVTDLIQGWTVRVAKMHQMIIDEEREFTDDETKMRDRYLAAIKTFDPKAMQNLLAYLKASYQFDLGMTGGGAEGESNVPDRPAGEGGKITFKGPTLVMFGRGRGGGNEKEKLFQVQGTGSKARARLIGNRQAERQDGGGTGEGSGEDQVLRGSEETDGDELRSDGQQRAASADLDRLADSPWG